MNDIENEFRSEKIREKIPRAEMSSLHPCRAISFKSYNGHYVKILRLILACVAYQGFPTRNPGQKLEIIFSSWLCDSVSGWSPFLTLLRAVHL